MTSPDLKSRSLTDIGLVYRREIESRLSSKGYFVGMAIMVLAVFGLVVGLDFANSPKTSTIAVCGAPVAAFGAAPQSVRLTPCPDLASARAGVGDKHVETWPSRSTMARSRCRSGCWVEAVTAAIRHSREMWDFLVRHRHLRQRGA